MKFLWIFLSRMAVFMGMLSASVFSTFFCLFPTTGAKGGDITTGQIILVCWFLISQSAGISIYLVWMADEMKKIDNELKKNTSYIIKEAEKIARGK